VFTGAAHVLRMVAGGHVGPSPPAERGVRPERCCRACGRGPVTKVWATATDGAEGLAWCRAPAAP